MYYCTAVLLCTLQHVKCMHFIGLYQFSSSTLILQFSSFTNALVALPPTLCKEKKGLHRIWATMQNSSFATTHWVELRAAVNRKSNIVQTWNIFLPRCVCICIYFCICVVFLFVGGVPKVFSWKDPLYLYCICICCSELQIKYFANFECILAALCLYLYFICCSESVFVFVFFCRIGCSELQM